MKNEDSLVCTKHSTVSADALINVWLLYNRARCGMFMENSVHAATSQSICAALRESKRIPFILYESHCACHHPIHTLYDMPVLLLFVTGVINQRGGCTYFNINLIVGTVAHGAPISRSRGLFAGTGELKQVGFPDVSLFWCLVLHHVCKQATRRPRLFGLW